MTSASDYIRVPNSEVRLEVILSLIEGAKPLSELQSDMQRRNTTILHALNDLAELNLVEEVDKDYKLTSLGVIEGNLLKSFSEMAQTLEKFQDLWLSHDIAVIPPDLILQIGALKDSRLIKTEGLNLGKVHSTFLEFLRKSKTIHGISPIFHEDYIPIFAELLEQGAKIELIVTKEILEEIESKVGMESILPYVEERRLRLFRRENLPVALTVTDNFLSLGLFTIQGSYDYAMDLVSSEVRAREWGESLYRYYRKKSTEISNWSPLG